MPPCGSLYRISVSFIKVVIIIMQAFSVKLKFHVFCCKTSIFFCVYLHCDGHCLYFCSLFIISCLFSAKSFTYCSYPLYNFLRRMLYNKITAREQEPDAVNLLITPSITVNTLTSLLPLSHNLSQAQKDRRSDAAVFLLGGRTAAGEGRPRMGRPDR